MEMETFLETLASGSPTPGGGGAAALSGAVSAALSSMVANLTSGKKKYAEFQPEIDRIITDTATLRAALYGFIARDAAAFAPLARAYGIPKDAPGREEMLEAALHEAAGVPLALLETLCELIPICERLLVIGSRLALSDVGCASAACRCAADSAALNVYINTKLMHDAAFAAALNARTDELTEQIDAACDKVYGAVRMRMRGEKA
ncbi:MAG: cyclodeaminase/cyclohydrolase family protein [Clostridiaceae bacterium]|nr:cyclodeaminase/cyclohydrolase family protein [Clostridiaceae bacterium]